MTGYFHLDQLNGYLDRHGASGPPSEAGWYVIEVCGYALGIGFLAPMTDHINFTRLCVPYMFDGPAPPPERGTLEHANLSEVRRHAPLRFDLNKEP